MRLLKKNGWSLNEPRPEDGFTPLCIACTRAHAPLAFTFVQEGPRVGAAQATRSAFRGLCTVRVRLLL